MKAMILAAGLGTRLKPYTLTTPKPLLKVGEKSLIAWQVMRLVQAGFRDIVINLSYLGEMIKNELKDGEKFGARIEYSEEPNEPLGTGGGIYKALPLLGSSPFVVMSADVWTDYPLSRFHEVENTIGHLILVPNPNYHLQGDYACENGYVTLNPSNRYTYASFGVLHPKIFKNIEKEKFPLTDMFAHAIADKMLTAEIYEGIWFNIGTIDELRAVQKLEQDRKINI